MASWKDKMKEGFGAIAEAAKEAAQENLTREKLSAFAEKAGEAAKELVDRGAELVKEAAESYEEAQKAAATWEPGQIMTVENTGYKVSTHLVMMSIDEDKLLFTLDDRFIKKSTPVYSFKWLVSAEFGITAERATFDETMFNIEDDVSGETWAKLSFVIPGDCRPDGESVFIDDKFTVQIYTPFERKRKEGFFKTTLEYAPPREFVRFQNRFLECWERAKME